MAHPLLDNYKVYKGIVNDTTNDTKISNLLYAVTDFLKNGLGIAVLKETGLQSKMSIKNHKLVFPYTPIEITSLTINGKSWDLTDLDITGNVVSGINEPLPDNKKQTDVVYNIGFDVVPFDLQSAIFILVSRLYENSEHSGESMEYLSDPVGARMRMLKQIPSEFYMLIHPYRSFVV